MCPWCNMPYLGITDISIKPVQMCNRSGEKNNERNINTSEKGKNNKWILPFNIELSIIKLAEA